MHISLPIDHSIEYIPETQISPFVSKGYCKVCYVGETPNRNHTVITKEVATEMGKYLPGSPVVGYYNEEKKDFEDHNRELSIKDGKFKLVDVTRPYGFVPTNAKVWFQKFNDEGIEHEYLCTEVYIWSGVYPESERVTKQGNNQSMELADEKSSGSWTNDINTNERFFIYNETLVKKLCLLGEDVEPCFEGSQVKNTFSLEGSPEFQKFQATMFSMLTELQETLSKGGSKEPMDENKNENPTPEFKKEDPEKEEKSAETSAQEESKEDKEKPNGNNACGEGEKKKEYSLDEITEYTELKAQYDELQGKYAALEQDKANLETEIASLREFKLTAEREQKQNMIDKFYMLSDEDKKDVIEHIDTYSLDDIEGKLSIICVRNKVNFNLEPEIKKDNPQGLFSLNDLHNDGAPDWIKAVRETAKNI